MITRNILRFSSFKTINRIRNRNIVGSDLLRKETCDDDSNDSKNSRHQEHSGVAEVVVDHRHLGHHHDQEAVDHSGGKYQAKVGLEVVGTKCFIDSGRHHCVDSGKQAEEKNHGDAKSRLICHLIAIKEI